MMGRNWVTALASIFVGAVLAACQPIQRETLADVEAAEARQAPAPIDSAIAPTTFAGEWEGTVEIAGVTLPMLASLTEADGLVAGIVRSPQQGDMRIPIHDVVVDGARLSFQLLEGPNAAQIDGEIGPDGAFEASFVQAGYEGKLRLTRLLPAGEVTEPELPYRSEPVTIEAHDEQAGDALLAGTLTLPAGEGPFAAVVLVSGSGPQDRNEDMGVLIPGFKPFAEIADALTRAGYAVLRYDDRGVGESTGLFEKAVTQTFAGDAQAAISYLRSREEIDPQRVGILGHSEGGYAAAMVAAADPDLGFAISLSGPSVSGAEVIVKQVETVAAASGATAEQAAQAARDQQTMVDAALAGDPVALKEAIIAAMRSQLEMLSAEELAALGDVEALIEQNSAVQVESLLSPWMQSFLRYDPAADWASAQAPVLAIFGTKDVQVDAEQSRGPLEAALARNPNVTIAVIENANHLYQKAETGAIQEYATLEPHMMPELFEMVVTWLDQHAGAAH